MLFYFYHFEFNVHYNPSAFLLSFCSLSFQEHYYCLMHQASLDCISLVLMDNIHHNILSSQDPWNNPHVPPFYSTIPSGICILYILILEHLNNWHLILIFNHLVFYWVILHSQSLIKIPKNRKVSIKSNHIIILSQIKPV